MFLPNQVASVERAHGFNKFGEPRFMAATMVPCAVVKLIGIAEKTTVRADSSASRGSAEELSTNAKLLFPIVFRPTKGDRVSIAGEVMRVSEVHPRFAVGGHLDHFETDLMRWN